MTHTIELIAPSGYAPDLEAVRYGITRLQEQGMQVENIEAAQRRFQRFGGTDSERAADINRLADPSRPLPDIVLAVRGGYGAVRILHGLDYEGLKHRLRAQPIAIVGHSDFTALQFALLAQANLPTFGGPMFVTDFCAENINEFTMRHFWAAVTKPSFTLTVNAAQAQSADLMGTLWGGNLTTIASLIGTPYMPSIQGGILFIEDVNEQPFRIERCIYQLHLAGILSQQQALVLGDFSGVQATNYDNGYGLSTMIEHIRSVIGIPVFTGLPFGHVPNMVTLPVGGNAHLVADSHGFHLNVSGYPYIEASSKNSL